MCTSQTFEARSQKASNVGLSHCSFSTSPISAFITQIICNLGEVWILKEKRCSNNVTSAGRVTGWHRGRCRHCDGNEHLARSQRSFTSNAMRSTLIYPGNGSRQGAPGMLIIRGHQSIMCSKDNRDGRKGKHQASFRKYNMVDVI